jgi:ATP-dependent helicase HepA
LAHEHWEFMTWEHPLTRAAMELLSASDLGTAAMTLVRDARLPRASLLLEVLYVAECQAEPALETGRFLPAKLLRLLIDESGRERAAELPHEGLVGQGLGRGQKLVSRILEARGERLVRMIEAAESIARDALPALREEAIACMRAMLDEELDRLSALARVNPTVHPREISALKQRRADLTQALARTELRLDALRLIITG